MNVALLNHEWLVLGLAVGLLLADLWLPISARHRLGYMAVLGLSAILIYSFLQTVPNTHFAFGNMYVLDGLALFFKRFFLLAALVVLLMSVEFKQHIQTAHTEYYILILFALAGMLFASSANDFALLFVLK